jgi:hypothetical protein
MYIVGYLYHDLNIIYNSTKFDTDETLRHGDDSLADTDLCAGVFIAATPKILELVERSSHHQCCCQAASWTTSTLAVGKSL